MLGRCQASEVLSGGLLHESHAGEELRARREELPLHDQAVDARQAGLAADSGLEERLW